MKKNGKNFRKGCTAVALFAAAAAALLSCVSLNLSKIDEPVPLVSLRTVNLNAMSQEDYATFAYRLIIDKDIGSIIHARTGVVISEGVDFMAEMMEGKGSLVNADIAPSQVPGPFLAGWNRPGYDGYVNSKKPYASIRMQRLNGTLYFSVRINQGIKYEEIVFGDENWFTAGLEPQTEP
ncbi:MAG: hypothetical protein LBQ55_00305 [Treponema sp.]|jgi:hypothetical protein|nr:hypothetical protein [Treponema sp.]